MPTLRSFNDPDLPDIAVPDSSFLFEAVIDPQRGDGRHEQARDFAARLSAHGTRLVVSSDLLNLEATQYWKRLRRRRVLHPIGDGNLQMQWMTTFQQANRQLDEFLSAFDVVTVDVSAAVLGMALMNAATDDLDSHDAALLALASTTGVEDIISLDKDFRGIANIRLWRLPPAPPVPLNEPQRRAIARRALAWVEAIRRRGNDSQESTWGDDFLKSLEEIHLLLLALDHLSECIKRLLSGGVRLPAEAIAYRAAHRNAALHRLRDVVEHELDYITGLGRDPEMLGESWVEMGYTVGGFVGSEGGELHSITALGRHYRVRPIIDAALATRSCLLEVFEANKPSSAA